MTSRREFLQIGITATALPLASKAARAAKQPAAEHVRLYKVVYDLRFPDSVAFAERAKALGLFVHAIEGDMTRFWYDDLYHRWKEGPAAIAGLTGRGAMFCFEQLARDRGMRSVFRAMHTLDAAGRVEHDLAGPLPMVRDSMDLDTRGGRWAACMAEVVASCPSGRAEITHARASSAVAFRPGIPDDDVLYSWVIAPAVKA